MPQLLTVSDIDETETRYTARVKTRTVWQRNIERLVGDEHGRQQQIAKKAGMENPQFSNLINSASANPQIKTLERVADALGVDVASLFAPTFSEAGVSHATPSVVASDASLDSVHVEAVLRDALVNILLDVLDGLQPPNPNAHTDESTPGSRTPPSSKGPVAPHAERKVRRTGSTRE